MLVEDDDTIRELLADILHMEGAEVTAASSGNEARSLLVVVRPQLIISDVMMPDGDGHELLRSVQADPMLNGVPFIFLTARSEPADQRRGMNLGADDYLVKPVSSRDLVDAVRARLNRSRVAGLCQRQLDVQFRDEYARRVPAELMTPLHTIRGAGEILQMDSRIGDDNQELVNMIITGCDRMARAVKRFWRLCELQATLRKLPAQEHAQPASDTEAIAGKLADTAKAIAADARRDADLVLDLRSVKSPFDEEDLVLMFRELVENAFRFSSSGSPVSVFAGAGENGWCLVICDQGSPMSPAEIEAMKRLMQGYPEDSTREPRGMGLAIVDSIARVYGFSVAFSPAQPRGLRVCVSQAGSTYSV